MIREFQYKIKETDDDTTILQYLKNAGYSHNVIVHLKKTPESILKNGVWSYVSERIHTGDVLEIKIIETDGSPKIMPIDLGLSVVYEDEDILVVNKPADMPIHPSYKNYDNTLANTVMFHYASQGIPYTFRCMNRLDRDTTGLTVLAKNMLAAGILSVAMQNREIQKEYYAICEGVIDAPGTVIAPIAREKDSAIRRCVDFESGEKAITHYRPVKSSEILSTEQFQKQNPPQDSADFTLLKLRLETGRTHQIRVHMSYIGHPLIGDFLYNGKHDECSSPDEITENKKSHPMKRQALHCSDLSFHHPVTGEWMHFQAPLPEDMVCFLNEYL